MTSGPRLSPRARARWASVLGVAVAATLMTVCLLALSSNVLPFDRWASGAIAGDEANSKILPATPEENAAAERSGGVTPGFGAPGLPGGLVLPGTGATTAAGGTVAPSGAAGAAANSSGFTSSVANPGVGVTAALRSAP